MSFLPFKLKYFKVVSSEFNAFSSQARLILAAFQNTKTYKNDKTGVETNGNTYVILKKMKMYDLFQMNLNESKYRKTLYYFIFLYFYIFNQYFLMQYSLL